MGEQGKSRSLTRRGRGFGMTSLGDVKLAVAGFAFVVEFLEELVGAYDLAV